MEDSSNINKIIGKNLLTLRKNKKLTQLELAEYFNYSDKTISKWETGESLPSIDVLYQIAQFYGVGLDALTSTEDIVSAPTIKPKDKLLPAKLIITLLAVSAVWILATVLYVTFKLSLNKNIFVLFFWAIPVSFIVLLIFNSIWGKKQFLFWILSLLLWTTLLCFHIQFFKYQIHSIYVLGLPIQISFILWAELLNKPTDSAKKEKKKQLKRERKVNKRQAKAIKHEQEINLKIGQSQEISTPQQTEQSTTEQPSSEQKSDLN